eukprot:1160948-Pelagomonas_calceolata.AAC.4
MVPSTRVQACSKCLVLSEHACDSLGSSIKKLRYKSFEVDAAGIQGCRPKSCMCTLEDLLLWRDVRRKCYNQFKLGPLARKYCTEFTTPLHAIPTQFQPGYAPPSCAPVLHKQVVLEGVPKFRAGGSFQPSTHSLLNHNSFQGNRNSFQGMESEPPAQDLPKLQRGVWLWFWGSACLKSFVRMAPGATSQNDAQTVDFPDPLNPCKVQSRDWLKTSVTRLEGVALAEEAVQAAVQAAAAAFTTDPFVGYYMRDPQQAGGLTGQ